MIFVGCSGCSRTAVEMFFSCYREYGFANPGRLGTCSTSSSSFAIPTTSSWLGRGGGPSLARSWVLVALQAGLEWDQGLC